MATASKVIKKKTLVKKPVAKKPLAKKPVAKKATGRAPVRRRVAKPAAPDIKPLRKSFTATELIQRAATSAEIEPKQVKQVLAFLQRVVAASLMKGGVGSVKLLGFNFKSKYKAPVKVPAIKKGTMIANPFAGGELQAHKGRPASVRPAKMVLKAMPMKAMKDLTVI